MLLVVRLVLGPADARRKLARFDPGRRGPRRPAGPVARAGKRPRVMKDVWSRAEDGRAGPRSRGAHPFEH